MMNEQESRARLQEYLDRLYENSLTFSETNLTGRDGNIGFVEYHTNRMYREFGGVWDDEKANEYLQSLEAEIPKYKT